MKIEDLAFHGTWHQENSVLFTLDELQAMAMHIINTVEDRIQDAYGDDMLFAVQDAIDSVRPSL